MAFDPILHDLPRDEAFPASMAGLVIENHGASLNGVIYIAAGEGPHGTILLLHGFPGHERNFDLAQVFRRAGWNVVVFHYRGSWGSGGDYRFRHVLEDVQTAVAFLRSGDAASTFRIDVASIILVGHSLGGWAALMSAASVEASAAASIAGANLGRWAQALLEAPATVRPVIHDLFSESLDPLSGVTATDLLAELEANAAAWDVANHMEALAELKLLLVAAGGDEVVPPVDHHFPLLKALQTAGAPDVTEIMIDSDHAFSDKRITLARSLLNWLEAV